MESLVFVIVLVVHAQNHIYGCHNADSNVQNTFNFWVEFVVLKLNAAEQAQYSL